MNHCALSLFFFTIFMCAMERPPCLIDVNAELDCIRQLSVVETFIHAKPMESRHDSLLYVPHYQIKNIWISASPTQIIKDLQNAYLFVHYPLAVQQKACTIAFASRMIHLNNYAVKNYVCNALTAREKLFFHPFIKMLGYIASANHIEIQVSPATDYFDTETLARFKILAANKIKVTSDELIGHYAKILQAIHTNNVERAITLNSIKHLPSEPSIDDRIVKLIDEYCD